MSNLSGYSDKSNSHELESSEDSTDTTSVENVSRRNTGTIKQEGRETGPARNDDNADDRRRKNKSCSSCLRATRNYQTQQQSILLGFANVFYSVSIERPKKKSNLTLQFFKVLSFQNGITTIDFFDLVNDRVKSLLATDLKNGISKKTALRRQDTNRINENITCVAEILKKFNFEFIVKTSPRSDASTKNRIVGITLDNLEFDRNDISVIGERINRVIMERLESSDNNPITIEKGDMEIMALLMGDTR